MTKRNTTQHDRDAAWGNARVRRAAFIAERSRQTSGLVPASVHAAEWARQNPREARMLRMGVL